MEEAEEEVQGPSLAEGEARVNLGAEVVRETFLEEEEEAVRKASP
jgi:hypothetical protein